MTTDRYSKLLLITSSSCHLLVSGTYYSAGEQFVLNVDVIEVGRKGEECEFEVV